MPGPVYLPSFAAPATWNGTPIGTSGWKTKIGGDLLDVSDTISSANGKQSLLACLGRNEVTLTMWFTVPPSSLGFNFGAYGSLITATISDTFRVAEVHGSSSIAGAVGVEVTLKSSNT